MVKFLPVFEYFTVFLKNKNITFKIRRSKVTDYAALNRENSNFDFSKCSLNGNKFGSHIGFRE